MHTNTESSYPDKSNIHIKQIRVNATESFFNQNGVLYMHRKVNDTTGLAGIG